MLPFAAARTEAKETKSGADANVELGAGLEIAVCREYPGLVQLAQV